MMWDNIGSNLSYEQRQDIIEDVEKIRDMIEETPHHRQGAMFLIMTAGYYSVLSRPEKKIFNSLLMNLFQSAQRILKEGVKDGRIPS